MSAFNTVFDFLKDVPKNQKHEEIYLEQVRSANLFKTKQEISLVGWENSVVGYAESNILTGLEVHNKFTLNGMNKTVPISVWSLAKQRDDPNGTTSKKHEQVYKKSFLSTRQKVLSPAVGRVLYPGRDGISIERDAALKGRVQAALPNLSAHQMGDISLASLGERLNIPTDMRHVFAKGYLILCDYNLSAASKTKDRYVDTEQGPRSKSRASSMDRMLLMLAYDIVVDADVFTPSERALLSLMCAPYPTVKYGENNVYNSINMEEDDLVFVSSSDVVVNGDYSFGSPDRMYHDMVEIANKMGCLEDMRVAFRDMRGLPFMLEKVAEYSGDTMFPTKYPKSYCMRNALGERDMWSTYITTRSNYLSTTKALIAELLLGEAYGFSMFAVTEELGAYGKVGCVTDDHRTDPVFNSNCRDYGLKHEDERVNILLQEWRAVKGSPCILGFRGALKRCIVNIAMMLAQKEIHVYDVGIPQVGFEMPFSSCKNSTWALIKGYTPSLARLKDGYEEVLANAKNQAFLFMMGVRQEVPKVGYNAFGARLNEVSSYSEQKFGAISGGEYKITMITYTMACDVTPRTDEMELTAIGIHHTRFKGTRCTVVVDAVGKEHIIPNLQEIPGERETIGKRDVEEKHDPDNVGSVHTEGGSRVSIERKVAATLERHKATFASLSKNRKLTVRNLKSFSYDSTGRKIADSGATGPTKYLYPRVTGRTQGGMVPMTRVPTDGEGLLCGIRAIGQDLISHGFLARDDFDKWVSSRSNDLSGKGNYGPEELAYLCNEMGFGMTLLTEDEGGVWRARDYGCTSSRHNVTIYHQGGAEGGHYQNVLRTGLAQQRLHPEGADRTPAESARAIAELGLFVFTD